MENEILIKITHKEAYTFFSSKELTEFVLGSRDCQVVVKAGDVEPYHLKFIYSDGDWFLQDISEKKTAKAGRKTIGIKLVMLKEGDVVYIFPEREKKRAKPSVKIEVMHKISAKKTTDMSAYDLTRKNEHIVGRSKSCDIRVENPATEAKHLRIVYDGQDCYLEDLHTIGGTYINNVSVKRAKLKNYDRISLPGAAYIFYENKLLFSLSPDGIEIRAEHVEKEVTDIKTRKKVLLVHDVNLTIAPGEMVGVVGGSGAGKSTFVDCLNGVRPCTSGKIYYDGNDYYENINSYRGVIGIVPQKDVMHDDLTLAKALYYTAQIKLRSDIGKQDLLALVQRAIDDVKLTGKENLPIASMSGGQKKRASIAMELLSDPKVLFLDEPTSGLSPDLDLEMMVLLKELASKGRTVVVITHAMENLDKCDKIAFLGFGGRLCFFDKPEKLLPWFGKKKLSDVFVLLGDESEAERYAEQYREKYLPKEKGAERTCGGKAL